MAIYDGEQKIKLSRLLSADACLKITTFLLYMRTAMENGEMQIKTHERMKRGKKEVIQQEQERWCEQGGGGGVAAGREA